MKKIILLLLLTFVGTSFCMQKEKSGTTLLRVDLAMPEQEFDKDKYFGAIMIEVTDMCSKDVLVTSLALVLGNFMDTYEHIESISKLSVKINDSEKTLPVGTTITSPSFFRNKEGKIYVLHVKEKRIDLRRNLIKSGFCPIEKVVLLYKCIKDKTKD